MNNRGMTILELLVVLTVATAFSAMAVFAFQELANDSQNGAVVLSSYFKTARAKALANTMAYTISPVSATRVRATRGASCTTEQRLDTGMILDLPRGARLDATDWQICYNTRGLSDASATIGVTSPDGHKTVEVVLGGAVRAL